MWLGLQPSTTPCACMRTCTRNKAEDLLCGPRPTSPPFLRGWVRDNIGLWRAHSKSKGCMHISRRGSCHEHASELLSLEYNNGLTSNSLLILWRSKYERTSAVAILLLVRFIRGLMSSFARKNVRIQGKKNNSKVVWLKL